MTSSVRKHTHFLKDPGEMAIIGIRLIIFFPECVKAFAGGSGVPSHIIFYRDGVGEGQLSHVYNTEVKQIKVWNELTSLD